METKQLNKVSMSLAVLDVMDKYHAVWSGLPRFAGMVTELEGLVAAVQEKGGIQGTRRTGIAEGKRRKQVLMIDLVSGLTGDLHAIAVEDGNAELAAKTDLHKSDLIEMADVEVGPACEALVKLAQDHAADLAGLGTDAVDIAAAEAAVKDYLPLVQAPRVATAQNKTVTEDIAALLGKIDGLYDTRLDRAMRKFAAKNKPFADDYRNARIIVDLGSRQKPAEVATPGAPAPVPA
jgi:hypothetical protein